MKASKSVTTLAGQQQQSQQQQANNSAGPTSPICRCRVTYLGSSVPHITKDGLQGIQEPLRELYPDKASLDQGNAGIDSWLSVWSNGILIENVDETGREVKRFFKIEALHYCAAVKFVPQAVANSIDHHNTLASSLPNFLPLDSPHARAQQANTNLHPPIFASILRRTTGVKVLECHAFICKREAAANALVRCCFHAYADTMYAKQIGAEIDNLAPTIASNNLQVQQQQQQQQQLNESIKSNGGAPAIMARRSKSIAALNDMADTHDLNGDYSDSSNRRNSNNPNQNQYQQQQQLYSSNSILRRKSLTSGVGGVGANYGAQNGDTSDTSQSIYSNNNLQKKHNFSKSMHQLNQPPESNYPGMSSSNYNDFVDANLRLSNQSTSHHNLSNRQQQQQVDSSVPEPFYNPYASRVPSYPPQSIIDQQQTGNQINNTGTLRSVKSVAANSIASTLLRSKKHAKAMSMAQLNNNNNNSNNNNYSNSNQNNNNNDRITSFHQPQYLHHNQPLLQHQHAATMGGPGSFLTLPPVPPMFLPNMPRLPQMNGSQTMKLPSRHQQQQHLMAAAGLGPMPRINFEAMTPKEMKKLLKKSAKYGIDPSRFTENGLPILPLGPMPMTMPPMPMPMSMHQTQMQLQMQPPPSHMPPPLPASINNNNINNNKSGTLGSQSLYSMDMNQLANGQSHLHDMTDGYNSQTLSYGASMGLPLPPDGGGVGNQMQPIKSILVKPNPEFLKSKAGKKWLKQQKEFKKLLPPHLDGLPIVFGPPPLDALEPANATASGSPALPPTFIHSPQLQPPIPHSSGPTGLPMMDSNGYYNPHPFYGPSGRASAASTLLRYSPHSQIMQQHHHNQQQALYEAGNSSLINGNFEQHQQQLDFIHRNQPQSMYSDPMTLNSQQQQLHRNSMTLQSQIMNHHQQHVNGNDSNSLLYEQSSSQLSTFDRQFPFGSERMSTTLSSQQRRRRNHMVEQSVISLGDEIDGEDDDDDGGGGGRDNQTQINGGSLNRNNNGNDNVGDDDDDDDGRLDGYYDQVGASSTTQSTSEPQQHRHNGHQRRRHHKSSSELNVNNNNNRRHDDQMATVYNEPGIDLQQQQQQQQQNDDHSSYSSAGIYKRKHINERAFSYSIRQEHKSNGTGTGSNSDADYVTDNDYSESNHQQMASGSSINCQINQSKTKNHTINNYQQQYSNNNNNNNNNHHQPPQSMTYDSPQLIYQQGGGGGGGNQIYPGRGSNPQSQYTRNPSQAQHHHHGPVDVELSARLESQLSMKSFANSGLKSHT